MDPILEKAKELLIDSVQILDQLGVEYSIVGGWIPYLQFEDHPGTKDVDILFRYGSSEKGIKEVIKEFLKNEFWLSAKHDFQLLKKYEINGNQLIYNVDFLHPTLEKVKSDMFVDHLEIDLGEAAKRVKKIKSIAIPFSEHFFKRNLITSLSCGSQRIPVINNTAFLLSKFPSSIKLKRQRDIFDIYLVIKNDQNALKNLLDLQQDEDILSAIVKDFAKNLQDEKVYKHYYDSLTHFRVDNPTKFLKKLKKWFVIQHI